MKNLMKNYKQKIACLCLTLCCISIPVTSLAAGNTMYAEPVDVSRAKTAIDLGFWSEYSPYGSGHVQGICVDENGKYMYASFTKMIAKIDMETGEIVGSVLGIADYAQTHIGGLTYYDGKIYAALECRNQERWYLLTIDGNKITEHDMSFEEAGIVKTAYVPEVDEAFCNELDAGEHNYAATSYGHKYGACGIDAITVGTLPGGGYDTDGDGVVDVADIAPKLLVVLSMFENVARYDNENMIILAYDLDDLETASLAWNIGDLTSSETTYTDEQSLESDVQMFCYVGNRRYGAQQMVYDKDTGDIWLECYPSTDKSDFSAWSRFLIDGSVPLYQAEVEVGQSVTGDATDPVSFVTKERANSVARNHYTDADGNYEQKWHFTLKCICGDDKTLSDHTAYTYGATGKSCKICGKRSQFDSGMTSLGNNLFYGAEVRIEKIDGVTYYGSVVYLYRLNRDTYTFESVGYPYISTDFEEGTATNDGFGGSKRAFSQSVSGTYSDAVNVDMSHTPKTGDTLHFSARVRVNNTDILASANEKNKAVSFVVKGLGKLTKTATDTSLPEERYGEAWIEVAVPASGVDFQEGEWVTLTAEKKNWDGKMRVSTPAGYGGATKYTNVDCEAIEFSEVDLRLYGSKGLTTAETVSEISYSVDDFEYWVSSDSNISEGGDSNIIPYSSMDAKAYVQDTNTIWSGQGRTFVASTSEDPAPDGSAGFMRFGATSGNEMSNAYVDLKTASGLPIKINRLYKVSLWARVHSTADSNKNTDGSLQTKGKFELILAANSRTADTNSYNMNNPGAELGNCLTCDWQKIEFYFTLEYKSFAEDSCVVWFRFSGTKSDVFDVDDVRMEDLGAIKNGSFDYDSKNLQVFRNLKYSTIGSCCSYNVFGWMEDGASTEISSGAMKVTSTQNGGRAYQGINMTNDGLYKLSFRAKTDESNAKPIAAVLDRYVSQSGGAKEVYDVPAYEYYTGTSDVCTDYTDVVKANQEWKVTNEWKTFECYISNEFDCLEGKSETANVVPRTPFLYFDVDGNKSGTSFYVDDITLTRISTAPVVDKETLSGENIPDGEIAVSAKLISPKKVEGGCVLIRAMLYDGKGYALLGTLYDGETFVVPEAMIGKNLVFEFTPVDGNGLMGEKVYLTPDSASESWGRLYFDAEKKNARAYYSENIAVSLIVAVYDRNNKTLKKVITEPVNLTAKNAKTVDTTELGIAEGDFVKIMMWTQEGMKPLSSAISTQKR